MAKGSCVICQEHNVGPEHEATSRHQKNEVLHQYNKNKKKLYGNRNGIIISCDALGSTKVEKTVKSKIRVSVKPNHSVSFNFDIKNDTKKKTIIMSSINLGHSKFAFAINGDIDFPITLEPKKTLALKINFSARDIGQYQVPVFFKFENTEEGVEFVIVRELIAYVEGTPTFHEKTPTPYADKEVKAKELLRKSLASRRSDRFRIESNSKKLYANKLKIPENASDEEIAQFKMIKDILESTLCPSNYIDFFHHLLWYEETITRINLKKYNMSEVTMEYESTRAGDVYKLFVPGLAEKRPSLLIGDQLFVKFSNTEEVMFEAKIDDIQENTAILTGFHESFRRQHSMESRFDIRFFMCRVTFERMHSALANLKTESQMHRLFPIEKTTIPPLKHINRWFNSQVGDNAEQSLSVRHIVSGTAAPAPYLVHGPPGTGKTVTIVEAILQLVKADPKNRILVCTDSNMAADHVATLLVKYVQHFQDDVTNGTFLLRANSRYRTWETMPDSITAFSNGTSRFKHTTVPIEKFVQYKIVITTLSHSAVYADALRRRGLQRHVSALFVDEAAQASEPALLVALGGLATSHAALVLAGDHRQLGPVAVSRDACARGLGTSLMERLKDKFPMYSDDRRDPNYIVMLRDNYRSHADILKIPNELFYQGLLRVQAPASRLSNKCILTNTDNGRAIEFHGVLSKELRMGKSPSYFNEMEVEMVLQYVAALLTTHGVDKTDIGIVTPYLRQVYKIKRKLSSMKYGDVEVGSVESFQGKEKRVIIISVVRANCALLDHDAKFKLGFLVDDKRFNVALTRAKDKVVIIGNPLCLQNDIKWRYVMHLCKEFHTYHGFDGGHANNNTAFNELLPLINNIKLEQKEQ